MMTEQQVAEFNISVDGLCELAKKAGYTDTMPFPGPATFTPEVKLNLTRFAIAIVAELDDNGKQRDIKDVMLGRISELATKHANHTPVENVSLTDMNAMLRSSAMEVFFVRFASAIALETKK